MGGDGAILVHIAARLQVPCIGIEIDEILCRTALRRAREASLSTFVDIVAADALYVDPSLASVITIFLVPSCLEVLSPKLKALCKSGTKILNIKFPLPAHHGWHPKATIECDDVVKIGSTARIYLYVVE